MTPALSSRATVLLLGGGELLLLAALGWTAGARATPWPALALYGVAFLGYAGAARQLRPAVRPGAAPAGPGRAGIWTVGIAGRLLLLFLLPHFSDDIWRYLWDGWVQVHGVNPYAFPPEAAAVEHLRTAWHGRINHPGVPTIYPPGAQLVFLAISSVGTSPYLFKAVWVAADLGVAGIVERMGRRSGGDGRLALLLYLWCPLLLVEVAWSGHLEPLGTLPLMAAVLVADRWRRSGDRETGGRPAAPDGRVGKGTVPAALGGTLLAAAASVKLAPAAGLPVLIRRRGWRAAVIFAVVAGLLAVPFLDVGRQMAAGLGEYVRRWSFYAGPHALLALLPGGAAAAKWIAAAAVGGLALAAARWRWSLERALFWILGAGLLLSPTLHPWYLLWVLPLAALRKSRGWILFTGLAFLPYGYLDRFLATGEWPQPWWLRALLWVPPVTLLAWDAVRRSARGGHGRHSP